MLTFNTWKSLAGVGDLAVKGRDMEEFGVVKGTKLLVRRQKTRNKKNFLGLCPSLKKKKKTKRKLFVVTEPSLKIYGARLGTEIMKDSVASRYRTAVSQILRTLKICLCFMVIFSPAPALSPDGTHSLFFHRMEVLLF